MLTVSSPSCRCDIGVGKWERCNAGIHRECQYPVMGLKENTMYQFRICAVNQAGVGRPSKPTDPVLTSDPLEPSRTTGKSVEGSLFCEASVCICDLLLSSRLCLSVSGEAGAWKRDCDHEGPAGGWVDHSSHWCSRVERYEEIHASALTGLGWIPILCLTPSP